MTKYADGYSTQDSRNSTEPMSHSGSFTGGIKDLVQGSSASNTVIATGANGRSVEVQPGGANPGVIGGGGSDEAQAQQEIHQPNLWESFLNVAKSDRRLLYR